MNISIQEVIIWVVTIIRFRMTENKEDVAVVKVIVGMTIIMVGIAAVRLVVEVAIVRQYF